MKQRELIDLMTTLDDAWNAGPGSSLWETFRKRHTENVAVYSDGNHTCSIADFSGTMKGPMKTGDGKVIPPTGKSFHVEFCTVATWNEKGEITEERLFYDLVGLMRQTGLA